VNLIARLKRAIFVVLVGVLVMVTVAWAAFLFWLLWRLLPFH
jgi:hypothetical protein